MRQQLRQVLGTRRHPSWLRILIIALVAALIGWLAAMYWPVGSAGAASERVWAPKSCPVWNEAGYSDHYNTMQPGLQQQVDSGAMSATTANKVICDPRYYVTHATGGAGKMDSKSKAVSAPQNVSANPNWAYCSHWRASGGFYYTLNIAGHEAGRVTLHLTWCWGHLKRHVYGWSGSCTGKRTTYGAVLGIAWQGCIDNDYVQKSWGGYYPGEITHQAEGHWDEGWIHYPDFYSPMLHITGHANGSCSIRMGSGKVWPWC